MADIGSDHAYLPISLLAQNKIERAIITDIASSPLNNAKKNVHEFMYDNFCSFRLGQGLAPLKPKEADCIVIAGMGGQLISEILLSGEDRAKQADFLILQPMQHTKDLREFLNTNHYSIEEERVVYDHGKYYEIIKARSGEQRRFTKLELEIGYAMRNDKTYFEFLDKKSKQYKMIIESRKKSKNNINAEEYENLLSEINNKISGS